MNLHWNREGGMRQVALGRKRAGMRASAPDRKFAVGAPRQPAASRLFCDGF
jgi:hypothetical protein